MQIQRESGKEIERPGTKPKALPVKKSVTWQQRETVIGETQFLQVDVKVRC